jgi:hypothetical protein
LGAAPFGAALSFLNPARVRRSPLIGADPANSANWSRRPHSSLPFQAATGRRFGPSRYAPEPEGNEAFPLIFFDKSIFKTGEFRRGGSLRSFRLKTMLQGGLNRWG